MLALARALAVSPKLVIADEMSLGLAPIVTESVFEGLEEARRSGITIVLTEQFVHRALAMADTCVILTRGQVGWSGPASEAGQEVIDRYLGEAEAPTPATGVSDCVTITALALSRDGGSPELQPIRCSSTSGSQTGIRGGSTIGMQQPQCGRVDRRCGRLAAAVVGLPADAGRPCCPSAPAAAHGVGRAGARSPSPTSPTSPGGRARRTRPRRPASTPASPCRTPRAA